MGIENNEDEEPRQDQEGDRAPWDRIGLIRNDGGSLAQLLRPDQNNGDFEDNMRTTIGRMSRTTTNCEEVGCAFVG